MVEDRVVKEVNSLGVCHYIVARDAITRKVNSITEPYIPYLPPPPRPGR